MPGVWRVRGRDPGDRAAASRPGRSARAAARAASLGRGPVLEKVPGPLRPRLRPDHGRRAGDRLAVGDRPAADEPHGGKAPAAARQPIADYSQEQVATSGTETSSKKAPRLRLELHHGAWHPEAA